MIIIGSSILSQSIVDIKDCIISSDGYDVTALCTYTITSTATGFSMIVQNINRIDELNVAEVTDRITPVTIHLGEVGVYQITVFPINGDKGIVNSVVGYVCEVIINGVCLIITPLQWNLDAFGTHCFMAILSFVERLSFIRGY